MESSRHRQGSESYDFDEPVLQGTASELLNSPSASTPSPVLSCLSRGVENAKKRLRAFSIQKKASVPPVTVVKPICTGNTTVLIGKLCSTKIAPKPEKQPEDDKKLLKPPKPGCSRKLPNDSYSELQKKTLGEIEEMKRKLELVELGIPLGLVCPSTNAIPVKAMPTKAMPPIKTFLADSFRVLEAPSTDKTQNKEVEAKRISVKNKKLAKSARTLSPHSAKIDEIIRCARKAKAEGKEFKFDYQKFVPDYDNPFQRKKEQDQKNDETERPEPPERKEDKKARRERDRRSRDSKGLDRRKSGRFDRRQGSKRDDREKSRGKERTREKDKKEDNRSKSRGDKTRDRDLKSKDKDDKHNKDDKPILIDAKAGDIKDKDSNKMNDEKKEEIRSPLEKPTEKHQDKDGKETKVNLNDYLVCDSWSLDTEGKNSPQVADKNKKIIIKDITTPVDPLEQLKESLAKGKQTDPNVKIEKLKPVVDCFEFEIDPNEDELLDEDLNETKFEKDVLYGSQDAIKYDARKDLLNDGMNDDMFLESVINEIKQEDMSDDDHHDKGLVEYDESPIRDSNEPSIGSVTPDLEDSVRGHSQRSDYSDGIKSVDSLKSFESGYKSSESRGDEIKIESKFTESNFKPIEPAQKSNDGSGRFISTESKSGHAKSDGRSRDRSKSSEGVSRSEVSQKPKGKPCKEQRELLSVDREMDEALGAMMSKDTVDSLETWSFVLKICQPLLFRHDKSKCYKETRAVPKLWFTANPKMCDCVMDRSIVYEELERCKMDLVNQLYSCDQIPDAPLPVARPWYPARPPWLRAADLASEWDEVDARPDRPDSLDQEYKKFMEAVSWTESNQERSTTPARQERKRADPAEEDVSAKRMKMSSEGWSQESEVEEEKTKTQKKKKVKERRKRKRSPSTLSSGSDSERGDKKKKAAKKKDEKKAKSKAKRRRLEKKVLKKLKEQKKKKKTEKVEVSDFEEEEDKEVKKKEKKLKRKKQQKIKKRAEKRKKRVKSTSTSSDSSSSDSSDSEVAVEKKAKKKKKDVEVKKKKKKEKKKRRKLSTSESQSEDLFDVNILNNIKTERLTDDEKKETRQHREIINVKELQDDFSSNIQIKQESEEVSKKSQPVAESPPLTEEQTKLISLSCIEDKSKDEEDSNTIEELPNKEQSVIKVPKTDEDEIKDNKNVPDKKAEKIEVINSVDVSEIVEVPKRVEMGTESMNRYAMDERYDTEGKTGRGEFKEPEVPTPPPRVDDTSQCSSQESVQSVQSVSSVKEQQPYEKDDSHLRPSCDNSNYSFNDVINSQAGYKNMEEKFEGYENYEMYEQMAMAYQSDVASQQILSPPSCSGEQRIETVVRSRARGEIKCDWRAGDGPKPGTTHRPSRWGLKPGEVNIVLTGGADPPPAPEPPPAPASAPAVYRIQSLANRDTSTGYDEAYMEMYSRADRLQYGDCFSPSGARSLHARVQRALSDAVLGEVAKDESDKDTPEKGILFSGRGGCGGRGGRGAKRVRFADGYRPGQDSDTEHPPLRKRKRSRRVGCAWPCPASHADHVPLWDALPPPPPPRGSPPPPPPPRAPPTHLLRQPRRPDCLPPPHIVPHKFNPGSAIPAFMPPEPPPGLITFP